MSRSVDSEMNEIDCLIFIIYVPFQSYYFNGIFILLRRLISFIYLLICLFFFSIRQVYDTLCLFYLCCPFCFSFVKCMTLVCFICVVLFI